MKAARIIGVTLEELNRIVTNDHHVLNVPRFLFKEQRKNTKNKENQYTSLEVPTLHKKIKN